MQRSILGDLGILLGFFGLIWLIASLFSFYPEDPKFLSVEKETRLGETYLELVLLNPMFKEFENERVDSSIQSIGRRLEEGLGGSEYTYHFVVFQSDMINAFTLPGGNILISTGLIRFCDSAEELAAVMAHEMGHVEKRHVISRLVKELGIELLSSGDPYVLGEVTGMLTSTRFDRKQEEEADLFACELLERSHMEPRTLASVFRRLVQEEGNEFLEHFEIISTHPNFKSRIREVLSYEPGVDFHPIPIGLDWDSIRSQL